MSDTRELLRRGAEGFEPMPDAFERVLARRERKRRHQRIGAGVVGIVAFVAAVWIVRDVASLNSSRIPANQPTPMPTTQPTETGPIVEAPKTGSHHVHPIPPRGTTVSTPMEGELIAEGAVLWNGYVRVYADGRVLSVRGNIVERRLSPKGVELVRSGAVQPRMFLPPHTWDDLPAGAWADHVGKPYVPARYGACFRHTPLDLGAVLFQLPASAQALLRGGDPAQNRGCLELSPAEARALDEILGSSRVPHADWPYEVDAWRLPDPGSWLSLAPLFPDGERPYKPGG